MKVLLGGIPLGCDNIGDEAIIACVVKMLRQSLPGVELTVATADPKTADLLGVEVVPPFGFAGYSVAGLADAVGRFDAYVWCGATGLSDYPHVALDLLEVAQRMRVPTFVWGVGMDDELNPVFFCAAGRRRRLLSLLGLVGVYEWFLRRRLARRLQAILPKCRSVWLRDPQSAEMLRSMGVEPTGIAADTAILLDRPDAIPLPSVKTLGLCISAQRQVSDLEGVRRLIAAVRNAGYRVLGIPMNPKTDRDLLTILGVESIPGNTPAAVAAAAAGCSVVLSSRLHLLILAANVGTLGLGIARGSKLANWLSNFGRTVEGSVSACDWQKVTRHVLSELADTGTWMQDRARAYEALHVRLRLGCESLCAQLQTIGTRTRAANEIEKVRGVVEK